MSLASYGLRPGEFVIQELAEEYEVNRDARAVVLMSELVEAAGGMGTSSS